MITATHQIEPIKTYSRRWIAIAICLAGLGVVAPKALARRRFRLPAAGLPRGARIPTGTRVLSRDELRHCVALESKIEAQTTNLEKHQGRISAKAAEAETLGARIKSLESQIDLSDQLSVERFNALVELHSRLVSEYNAMLPAYNAKVSSVDSLIDGFNSICADRVYYLDDMAAVRAGS